MNGNQSGPHVTRPDSSGGTAAVPQVRVRVYVDGFNFYYGGIEASKDHRRVSGLSPSWKWLDIAAMCLAITRRHWQGATIDKASYFTAPVKERYRGDLARDRQDVYLRALQRRGVVVVRGRFLITAEPKVILTDPNDTRSLTPDRAVQLVRVIEEKGSDVNLATALLVDYFTERSAFDASVVVSNDSDLGAPVTYLRNAGWPTAVLNPHRRPAEDLWPKGLAAPHFGARIEFADIVAWPLPDPLTDPSGAVLLSKQGNPLRKPPSW